MNELTPLQALEILDLATQPTNISRLTRADFTNINTALQVLFTLVQPNTEQEDKPDTKSLKKTKEA